MHERAHRHIDDQGNAIAAIFPVHTDTSVMVMFFCKPIIDVL